QLRQGPIPVYRSLNTFLRTGRTQAWRPRARVDRLRCSRPGELEPSVAGGRGSCWYSPTVPVPAGRLRKGKSRPKTGACAPVADRRRRRHSLDRRMVHAAAEGDRIRLALRDALRTSLPILPRLRPEADA